MHIEQSLNDCPETSVHAECASKAADGHISTRTECIALGADSFLIRIKNSGTLGGGQLTTGTRYLPAYRTAWMLRSSPENLLILSLLTERRQVAIVDKAFQCFHSACMSGLWYSLNSCSYVRVSRPGLATIRRLCGAGTGGGGC